MVNIKVINKGEQKLPEYKTSGSAGMDLRSDIEITLGPGCRTLVPTGLVMSIPKGYEGQIRPRSGLAFTNAITVLNSPGTIDSDFRGEIQVLLINLSNTAFLIHRGDRIAQMIISRCEQANLIEMDALDKTERGFGGYGHTGVE